MGSTIFRSECMTTRKVVSAAASAPAARLTRTRTTESRRASAIGPLLTVGDTRESANGEHGRLGLSMLQNGCCRPGGAVVGGPVICVCWLKTVAAITRDTDRYTAREAKRRSLDPYRPTDSVTRKTIGADGRPYQMTPIRAACSSAVAQRQAESWQGC